MIAGVFQPADAVRGDAAAAEEAVFLVQLPVVVHGDRDAIRFTQISKCACVRRRKLNQKTPTPTPKPAL